MSAFAGAAPEVVSISGEHVTLTVDAAVYPLESVYAASYIFLDRCFVLLDRTGDRFRVTLAAKKAGADDAALSSLVGEFANELLACAYRQRIVQENRSLIEQVTSQALSGAMGPPSLDELKDFDFSEDAFEDPLGIASSWEEKYKKKPKAPGSDDGAVEGASEEPRGEGAS